MFAPHVVGWDAARRLRNAQRSHRLNPPVRLGSLVLLARGAVGVRLAQGRTQACERQSARVANEGRRTALVARCGRFGSDNGDYVTYQASRTGSRSRFTFEMLCQPNGLISFGQTGLKQACVRHSQHLRTPFQRERSPRLGECSPRHREFANIVSAIAVSPLEDPPYKPEPKKQLFSIRTLADDSPECTERRCRSE